MPASSARASAPETVPMAKDPVSTMFSSMIPAIDAPLSARFARTPRPMPDVAATSGSSAISWFRTVF